MALQLQGNGGTVAEVESATRAMRTALRPIDIGSLGSYRKAMTSGTIAAGLAGARSSSACAGRRRRTRISRSCAG